MSADGPKSDDWSAAPSLSGGGDAAADLIAALRAQPDSDIRICGIFDDRDDKRSPALVAGYPEIGTVSELVAFGRVARIDILIVSLLITAENRLLHFLKQLWVLPVDVRLSAHSNKLRFRPRSYSCVGNVPFLDIFDKPIADWDSVAKRAFDVVCASLLVILFCPIMLLTALAIKVESKGPVLFRQERYGFNNEVIEVLKFRSMRHDMSDPQARQVVTRDDPRVTRVGRFIRRTSIDELPQLINVIRGDLSLVGPRPHAVNAHTGHRLWNDVVAGTLRGTGSSRASPAGRRSMAGAARSMRTRKYASGSNMIFFTSRTGRCCSTSTSWR